MKIYLGTDHAGFEAKEKVNNFLVSGGHEVVDCGAYTFDANDDYPDFISKVGEAISKDSTSFGFVFGGSGHGEAICANRYPHVRAVVYYGGEIKEQEDAGGKMLGIIASAREHNNANVLSLGVRFLTDEEILRVINIFLKTPFSGDERHVRRINKLEAVS